MTNSPSKRDRLRGELEVLITGMQPHQRLPSERELTERFEVSRMTLRSVLMELQREGRIYSVQGSGTYVSESRVSKRMHLTSFTEDMQARGMTPSTTVLRAEVVDAPVVLAEAWGKSVGRVFRLLRVRFGNQTPMCIEEAFIDITAAPDLLANDLTGSLYQLLDATYDRGISRATHTVEAVTLDKEQAALMGAQEGEPALQFTQVGFDSGGRPVEFCISTKRADIFSLKYSVEAPTS